MKMIQRFAAICAEMYLQMMLFADERQKLAAVDIVPLIVGRGNSADARGSGLVGEVWFSGQPISVIEILRNGRPGVRSQTVKAGRPETDYVEDVSGICFKNVLTFSIGSKLHFNVKQNSITISHHRRQINLKLRLLVCGLGTEKRSAICPAVIKRINPRFLRS